jgi:glutaconate CoA-transferase subunit B
MAQSRRTFVAKVDFITSFGYGEGANHRRRLGLDTAGPTLVVTDLCLMRPNLETQELTVVSMHAGVTRQDIMDATGWPIQFAAEVETTLAPTDLELGALRDLQLRTARAHSQGGASQ